MEAISAKLAAETRLLSELPDGLGNPFPTRRSTPEVTIPFALAELVPCGLPSTICWVNPFAGWPMAGWTRVRTACAGTVVPMPGGGGASGSIGPCCKPAMPSQTAKLVADSLSVARPLTAQSLPFTFARYEFFASHSSLVAHLVFPELGERCVHLLDLRRDEFESNADALGCPRFFVYLENAMTITQKPFARLAASKSSVRPRNCPLERPLKSLLDRLKYPSGCRLCQRLRVSRAL